MLIPAQHPLATYLREPALLVPGQQPRGDVRPAQGCSPLILYLMGARYQLRDFAGSTSATLTNASSRIEDIYFSQDSTTQYMELDSDVGAGRPVTILLYLRKDRTSATTDPYKVLAAMSNASIADEATRYIISIGNDFGGAGTKEKIRAEMSNSSATGMWINGDKQVLANRSDAEWPAGSVLSIVVRCSSLPNGLGNTRFGGGQGSFSRGMKGPIMLGAILDGELPDDMCAALSANPYSLFEPANQSPYLVPVAAPSGTTITLVPDSLTLTPGTLPVKVSTSVSLIPDTITLTGGAFSVQADVDTNISLIPDSLSLTGGTLPVSSYITTSINLTPAALTLTPGQFVISTITPVVTLAANESATFYMKDGTAHRIFN